MPFIEVLKRLSEEEEGLVTTPADEMEGVLLDDSRYIELTAVRNQLFEAIRARKMVYFRYAKFGSRREFGLRFHPHLLREYQGRWYVLGDKEQGSQLLQRVYGLERIRELEVLEDQARTAENDPKDYFRDIIGVSRPQYREVEEVRLTADRKTADYLRSQPWHASQKEIRTEGKWTEFSLEIVHNTELESLILGAGKGLRVLRPETLRARMREVGEDLRKLY
jgi:predicted DNA-binding transcriptional regulator YafY